MLDTYLLVLKIKTLLLLLLKKCENPSVISWVTIDFLINLFSDMIIFLFLMNTR